MSTALQPFMNLFGTISSASRQLWQYRIAMFPIGSWLFLRHVPSDGFENIHIGRVYLLSLEETCFFLLLIFHCLGSGVAGAEGGAANHHVIGSGWERAVELLGCIV